jgi:hypothetical protein
MVAPEDNARADTTKAAISQTRRGVGGGADGHALRSRRIVRSCSHDGDCGVRHVHLLAIVAGLLLGPGPLATAGGKQAPAGMRIPVARGWTVVVPADFDVINNRDSLQALKGKRIVYLSAPALPDAATADGAHALCEQMSALFVGVPPKDRLTHATSELEGLAGVFLDGRVWRFKGVMCAHGAVALAVADLSGAKDRDWAVAVWRSFERP